MNNYFEKARELGKMILESEFSIRLSDARAAYENDDEAKRLMDEYVSYQANVKQAMETGEFSKEEFSVASQRLMKMVTGLKSHPIAGEFIRAENDFNFFTNQVLGVLKSTITGIIEDENCNGACDGCSGCNH